MMQFSRQIKNRIKHLNLHSETSQRRAAAEPLFRVRSFFILQVEFFSSRCSREIASNSFLAAKMCDWKQQKNTTMERGEIACKIIKASGSRGTKDAAQIEE